MFDEERDEMPAVPGVPATNGGPRKQGGVEGATDDHKEADDEDDEEDEEAASTSSRRGGQGIVVAAPVTSTPNGDDGDDGSDDALEDANGEKQAGAGAENAEEDGEGEPNPKRRKKKAEPRRWTQVEDSALCSAVKLHGECNWKSIAAAVGTRNHMQCLQRWKKVLKPGLVKGSWLPADDEALMRVLDGVDSSRIEWATVAQHFPMRSARDCRERWKYFLSPLAHDHMVSNREPAPSTDDRNNGRATAALLPSGDDFHSGRQSSFKGAGSFGDQRFQATNSNGHGLPSSNGHSYGADASFNPYGDSDQHRMSAMQMQQQLHNQKHHSSTSQQANMLGGGSAPSPHSSSHSSPVLGQTRWQRQLEKRVMDQQVIISQMMAELTEFKRQRFTDLQLQQQQGHNGSISNNASSSSSGASPMYQQQQQQQSNDSNRFRGGPYPVDHRRGGALGQQQGGAQHHHQQHHSQQQQYGNNQGGPASNNSSSSSLQMPPKASPDRISEAMKVVARNARGDAGEAAAGRGLIASPQSISIMGSSPIIGGADSGPGGSRRANGGADAFSSSGGGGGGGGGGGKNNNSSSPQLPGGGGNGDASGNSPPRRVVPYASPLELHNRISWTAPLSRFSQPGGGTPPTTNSQLATNGSSSGGGGAGPSSGGSGGNGGSSNNLASGDAGSPTLGGSGGTAAQQLSGNGGSGGNLAAAANLAAPNSTNGSSMPTIRSAQYSDISLMSLRGMGPHSSQNAMMSPTMSLDGGSPFAMYSHLASILHSPAFEQFSRSTTHAQQQHQQQQQQQQQQTQQTSQHSAETNLIQQQLEIQQHYQQQQSNSGSSRHHSPHQHHSPRMQQKGLNPQQQRNSSSADQQHRPPSGGGGSNNEQVDAINVASVLSDLATQDTGRSGSTNSQAAN